VFVPGDGGTGSPGDLNGSGSVTGTPGGTGTGGTSTGDLTGTGGTSGTSTNGVVTDGTGLPTSTTAGDSTSSSGVTPAPEPDVLWLVTGGLIAVARRRLGRR
jgi:hypothetical protein